MKKIAQEHTMGCAVACVASLIGITYSQALSLFKHPENVADKGYKLRAIIDALQKKNNLKKYHFFKYKNQDLQIGDIVYIDEPKPSGHYLLNTKKGWMNPWINSPRINPAKAGFQKELNGKVLWVIREK